MAGRGEPGRIDGVVSTRPLRVVHDQLRLFQNAQML